MSADDSDKLDAMRYRWLRDEHAKINPLARVNWKWKMNRNSSEWVNTASCETLDDAIDAAMKESA